MCPKNSYRKNLKSKKPTHITNMNKKGKTSGSEIIARELEKVIEDHYNSQKRKTPKEPVILTTKEIHNLLKKRGSEAITEEQTALEEESKTRIVYRQIKNLANKKQNKSIYLIKLQTGKNKYEIKTNYKISEDFKNVKSILYDINYTNTSLTILRCLQSILEQKENEEEIIHKITSKIKHEQVNINEETLKEILKSLLVTNKNITLKTKTLKTPITGYPKHIQQINNDLYLIITQNGYEKTINISEIETINETE